jgi:hypothetical protein
VGADSALTLESIFGLTHHGRGSASVSVWFRAAMQGQSRIDRIGENGSAADQRQQVRYLLSHLPGDKTAEATLQAAISTAFLRSDLKTEMAGPKLILTSNVRKQDIIQNSQNPAFPHVLKMDLVRPKIFEELGPHDQREMAI